MKRLVTIATFLFASAAASSSALAYGIGVYLDGGLGTGSISAVEGGGMRSHISGVTGVGFALDSNLARDISRVGLARERKSYRLKLGYQRQDWDDGVLLNGVTVDGILGYRLWSKAGMRLWAGPAVRLQYLWGSESVTTSYFGFAGEHEMKNDLTAYGPGLGLVLGLNVPTLGLGVELGYVFNYLFGSASGIEPGNRSVNAMEGHLYGSVVLMFQ